jgi:hypothetical protein
VKGPALHRKLLSERNTPTIKRKVLAAARKHFRKRKGIRAFFDHGHWWVEVDWGERSGRGHSGDGFETYDVVDVESRGSVGGFGFEEV